MSQIIKPVTSTKMAHSPFYRNISQSWNPSFHLPTAVTFQIVTSGKEVQAHKYVLALDSTVFKREFFKDSMETKDVIPI